MRKLLKFIILALISTAIICGCIFVGMYAIEEENSGTSSSSDSADESNTSGSSDSTQPSSDYEGAGSGTLAFGSAYSWGSTSDVCAISYSSTMTYQTKATVKIGATTYTATSVTAAINPDVYGELEAAGAFNNDGITESIDITSNFTMASVFDNLIYYDDDNISELASLLSGYYTAGTPLIVITSTYNKSYATFGLLVDVEGMYYGITYSTTSIYGATTTEEYKLAVYVSSYFTDNTKKGTEGDTIKFTVYLYGHVSITGSINDDDNIISTGGGTYYTGDLINTSCEVSIYKTDDKTELIDFTTVSTGQTSYYWYTATYSFIMPDHAVTIYALPVVEGGLSDDSGTFS